MAEKIVLQIEARMLDEATKVLREIGIEATKTGEKGESSFAKWGKSIGAMSVQLNQGLELMMKFGRAVGAVGHALAEPVRLAAEEEVAQVKLAAALRATNNALGVGAQELVDFAEEVERTTGVSGEMVVEAEAVLLTFTKVGRDAFPRAIRAANDMSVILGGDLRGAVVQLGKALNDPIQGMAALGRVGVQFTQSQKDMVEQLVRSGELLKAQGIILDEVEGRMGGVAEQVGATFQGDLKAVGNAWENLLEELGHFITDSPVVKAALRAVAELLERWKKTLEENGPGMQQFRAWFDEMARDIVPKLLRGFGAVAGALIEITSGTLQVIQAFRELNDAPWLSSMAKKLVEFERGWLISNEEAETRLREIEEAYASRVGSGTAGIQDMIAALDKAKTTSRQFIEEQAAALEGLSGRGSVFDKMVQEEELKKGLEMIKGFARQAAAELADIGFSGLSGFAMDRGAMEAATRQQDEFESRMDRLRMTALDRQLEEVRAGYDEMLGAQREALQQGIITEEQFNLLRLEIEAQQSEALQDIRDADAKTRNDARKKELDAIKAHEAAILQAFIDSANAAADTKRTELELLLTAEDRRYFAQVATADKLTDNEEERIELREQFLIEHLARIAKIKEEFDQKERDRLQSEQERADAAAARDRERARDQMEFQRDLENQIAVFQTQGVERRLAEANRAYENERAAIERRAAALEIDAGTVQQFLAALELEHARTIEELTGTTSEGIKRAIQEVRDSRETEFEFARNAMKDVIQTSEEALANFLLSIADRTKTVEEKFRALVATIIQEMARIAAQRAASQIFAAIGFEKGGVMQGQKVEMRSFASGGVARRPTMALFAEVPGKAEAFVPLPDGQRIPVKLDITGLAGETRRRGDGGLPGAININFSITATDAAGVDRIIENRRAQIQAMIVDGLRTLPGMRAAVRESVGQF